jgi:hypothetical protein
MAERYKVIGESTETPEPEKPRTAKVVRPTEKTEPIRELTTAQMIANGMINTPDDRLPEMTILTKRMAFLISVQYILNPRFTVDGRVRDADGNLKLDADGDYILIDLPSVWENIYMKLCRSIGGKWADNYQELMRIQVAGIDDDDFDMGDAQ